MTRSPTNSAMPTIDPEASPKTAAEMAAEGDREGSVLRDTPAAEIDLERPEEGHDPDFARNGE